MSDDSPVSGNGQPHRPMWQVQPGPVAGPEQPEPPQGPPPQGGKRAYYPPQEQWQQPRPTPQQPSPQQPAPQQPAPQQPGQHQHQPPTAPQQPGQQQMPQHTAPHQGPAQGQSQGPAQGLGTNPHHPVVPPTGPPQQAQGVPAATPPDQSRAMTAQEFLQARHQSVDIGPATWGWRGFLRKATFGLVKPRMGRKERDYREARAVVQRSFSGPRTIVFANPKGGAAKTTSVLAAGYTFGTIRGGGVVAWDNNETRGTLGIRGERANHQNTTRELLDDLERFQDVYESRIGDLGAFVRSQGDAHFDVLASDERADVTGTIRANDFGAVHRLLERFYHLILVDTGNNLRAENWLAAAQAADLIVVTCTVREDTGYSGLWMLDALADAGHMNLREKVITVLADPDPSVDQQLAKDLTEVYAQRTREVFRIPYDPALVSGSVIQYGQISDATRSAWLRACAAMSGAL